MKSYIGKLHVKEIGIFNSLDIEFSPDVNIIIGANSTGKTSILKCITYCFSYQGLNFTRFRKDAEFWADFHNKDGDNRTGAIEVVDTDQAFRNTAIKKWGQVPTENNIKAFAPHMQVPYNLFAIGAHRYFDYTRIDGMKREAKGEERKKHYDQNNSNYLEKPSLPAIKQWMINRYFIIEKEWATIEKSNWQRVIDFLPVIVPKSQNFEFNRIERDLEPIFTLNKNECYLEELSGGFKSILSVIFSIIDWCEGVNEGEEGLIEKACGTVLIDEIDAHLHPEWQFSIVKNLKNLFPNLQFIFTTHSPHVISSAEKNEIIRIPAHTGELNLTPLNESYKGWQTNDILYDLMGVPEVDDLNAKKIIAELDKIIENKDLEGFERELVNLKGILHANDPILKVYEIKRSKLLL